MKDNKKLKWTDIYFLVLDIIEQYSKKEKKCIEMEAKFIANLYYCQEYKYEDDKPPYTELEKLLRKEKVCS